MLTLVIPLFRSDEWLRPLLSSIGRHTATPYELVLVHDGSATDVPDALMQKMPACMDVKQAVLLQQRGFPRAVNCGIHLAANESRYIAVLNADIDLPAGWEKRLIALLDANPKMGVVVPMTAGSRTLPHPSQFVAVARNLPCRDRSCVMAVNMEVQRASRPPHFVERPMVPFFCAMFERSRLLALSDAEGETVGLLDDGFADMRVTFGLGEDDDWCYRARRKGLFCAAATNVFVWHRWGSVFTEELRRSMTPRAMERLSRKWGAGVLRPRENRE